MSDAVADLAPTVTNFDAIVARNSAKAESGESGRADSSGADPALEEAPDFYKIAKERESRQDSPDDDVELDDAGDEVEEQDPLADPADSVEAAVRAPLKALREALKTKTLTPELMEEIGDLQIELKLPGGVKKMALRDMPNGVMLQARFTREMEKAKDVHAKAANIVQIEQARTHAWRNNPAELYRGLQAMGCDQTLQQVWHWMTEQRYNYVKAPPEERQRMDYMRQVEAQRQQEQYQLMQAKQELEQLRRGQQQQQIDPITKQVEDHVMGAMDPALSKAFKRHGISGRATGHPHKLFLQHLSTLSEGLGPESFELIDQNIELAADLAAEAWKHTLGVSHQEHEKKQPKQELPARRAPAGTPAARSEDGRFQAPRTNGVKNKAKPTAEEFARRFGR